MADYFLQLCGDGPSAADCKSQAAWAGGVGKTGGKGEDTSGWAGGCCFPFPPSDPFKGLRWLLRLVSVFLVAGLSPRKFKPGIKGTQGRKRSSVRTAAVPSWPPPSVSSARQAPTRPVSSPRHGSQTKPPLPHRPDPRMCPHLNPQHITDHNLPLNEPQNGGCQLGRRFL